MHVIADPFWLPKDGNSDAEYEDAFWPQDPMEKAGECVRFAVADGATEASYSGLWARLLVEAIGRGRLCGKRYAANLSALQAQWRSQLTTKELSWFAEEKVRSGAFSSFLGLVLCELPTGKRKWRTFAIGDSCVVQIRRDEVVMSFPIQESTSFNNRPILLSSNPARNADGQVPGITGSWESEDCFCMMTDALACWFLTEIERGGKPWEPLRDMQPQEHRFARFVGRLRRNKSIRNDDVTLLRISVN